MNMVHFFKNLETLSAASKSALKAFAACPTESNQAYFIGYLAALLSNKLISTDPYNYFVTLAGRIALDKHTADRVYWELRVPNRVRVHTNKKYPEILSAEW